MPIKAENAKTIYHLVLGNPYSANIYKKKWLALVQLCHQQQAMDMCILQIFKGQIISKGLFGVLKSSQKRNKRIHRSSKKNSRVILDVFGSDM